MLEDEHQDPEGRADREQVQQHGLGRDHDRAEGDEHQQEGEQQHEAEHEWRLVAICSLKSFAWAVYPVTATSASASVPSVGGMISSRSAVSASFEVASVPSPSTGIEMLATVLAALTSTSIGSFITPV